MVCKGVHADQRTMRRWGKALCTAGWPCVGATETLVDAETPMCTRDNCATQMLVCTETPKHQEQLCKRGSMYCCSGQGSSVQLALTQTPMPGRSKAGSPQKCVEGGWGSAETPFILSSFLFFFFLKRANLPRASDPPCHYEVGDEDVLGVPSHPGEGHSPCSSGSGCPHIPHPVPQRGDTRHGALSQLRRGVSVGLSQWCGQAELSIVAAEGKETADGQQCQQRNGRTETEHAPGARLTITVVENQ